MTEPEIGNSLIALQTPCTYLSISANVCNGCSVYVGDNVIFTATVQPVTESYPVEFTDQNNNVLGACITSGGSCSISWNTTGLSPGTYTITARGIAGCTAAGSWNIVLLPKCTSMVISADKMFAFIGETIMFTTTIQPSTLSYWVRLLFNNNPGLGTCTTSGGTCTFDWNTAGWSPGTYNITGFATESLTNALCTTSTALPITLLPACSTIYASVDKTSVHIGDTVKFSISVNPSTQSYPVQIKDPHNNLIGTCTTSGGACSFNWDTTGLNPGIYDINISTEGGCNTQVSIILMATCSLVNITTNTTSAEIGDLITFYVDVMPTYQPFNVQLKDQDNNLVGNCTTVDGVCSISWDTSGLNSGSYTITARVVDGTAGQCTSMPVTVILKPQTDWIRIVAIAMIGLAGTVLYALHKK